MGKITKIEVQNKNKERVNIYIDYNFSFACDIEFIYKLGIKVNDFLDKSDIDEVLKDDELKKCKNSALKIIEKSYKSKKEMREKLLAKGFTNDIINSVLNFLEEYKFIDDTKYATLYIKDKIKNQGRNKIKYSLIKKGLSENIIEENLECIDKEYEKEQALSIAIKRYEILKKREDDKYKLSQKLFRFLATKGYDFECCSEIVKKVVKRQDIWE